MSDKLNWVEVDEAGLSKALREQLAEAKAAMKVAAEKRDAWNQAFIAAATKAGKVPSGKELVVSHKFGKLTVAITDKGSKSSGTSKPKFSF